MNLLPSFLMNRNNYFLVCMSISNIMISLAFYTRCFCWFCFYYIFTYLLLSFLFYFTIFSPMMSLLVLFGSTMKENYLNKLLLKSSCIQLKDIRWNLPCVNSWIFFMFIINEKYWRAGNCSTLRVFCKFLNFCKFCLYEIFFFLVFIALC